MKRHKSAVTSGLLAGFLAFSGCLSGKSEAATQSRDATAAKLVLVEEGVSRAPVIVFAGAPPMTRRAADELAGYIDKISGAKPQVIEGTPDPIPERAIWVGYQPKLKQLFPKIDFDFRHPEEILIAANGNHLVIAGRDRWNPERLVVEGRNFKIEGKQTEYGTANAVYTFLQDYLDVRWLWPGETGEDVVKRDTIAIAPLEYRYHPQIRQRAGLFRLSALGDGRGLSHDWTRCQRLQLDSLWVSGGHAFTDWWDKYHEEHPDYFALQPDGTRSGFPSSEKAKICQANPEVWEQWLDNVAQSVRNDPDQIVFSASPNDSYHRGHCICEKCRAWDHPDGELLIYTWEGLSQEYVALSDRQVTFANTLARLLKERFPEPDLYVCMHAYGHYRPAPVEAVPDDNVIISSVANFFLRPREMREIHMGQFKAWAKVAPHIMWRPNTGSPAGWQSGLPDVAMSQAIEDFRFIAENHCIGLYFDTVWEHWATQGPQYYVMAQLAWNPWVDGQAVLADYYRRGFGAAAEETEAYWTLMEDTRNELVRSGLNSLHIPQVYTKQLLDRADRLLQRAAAEVGDQPEKHRRRVEFVRVGLEYTRLVINARALMQRIEESKGEDTEAAMKVRAVWDDMRRLWEEHPLAFNSRFLRGPANRRMQGLHPDSPL